MSDSASDQRKQSTILPATIVRLSIGDQVRWISSDRFAHPEEEGPGIVRSVINASGDTIAHYAVEFSSGSHTLFGDQLRFARRLSDWCDISRTQFLSGGITGPWHWVPAREDIIDRVRKIPVTDKAA